MSVLFILLLVGAWKSVCIEPVTQVLYKNAVFAVVSLQGSRGPGGERAHPCGVQQAGGV